MLPSRCRIFSDAAPVPPRLLIQAREVFMALDQEFAESHPDLACAIPPQTSESAISVRVVRWAALVLSRLPLPRRLESTHNRYIGGSGENFRSPARKFSFSLWRMDCGCIQQLCGTRSRTANRLRCLFSWKRLARLAGPHATLIARALARHRSASALRRAGQSASLASAPDPRPSRVPRTRLRETGNGSAARPCGAGCKQGNRKGLRLWCLRINRLQTKTETPFRFGRTRAGSASSKHARSRPAAGWLASPRRALEWRHSSDRWTGVARRSAGLAGGLKSLRAGTFRER
jgi:hypothetical protein